MKAALIHRYGDCSVFSFEEVADPSPDEGCTLIKVLGCGINRYDLFLRMGGIRKPIVLPHVMGADIAGEVVRINGDTHGLSVGQRVVAAPGFPADPREWQWQPENRAPSYNVTGTMLWGGYAQFVKVPTCFVLPDRSGLPAEQVAAMPLVTVTAVHAVETLGEVQSGQRVLVQAGASGSGAMCVQLARHLGARVIATVGGDEKIDFVRACGAEEVINHRREDFVEATLRWAGAGGADVVIDNVGGSVLAGNLRCLRTGGILVNFGLVGGIKGELNFANLIFGQYQIRGSMMGSMEELRRGLSLFEAGILRPNLDRTFSLRAAGAAHEYIESRQVRGKVVLLPWSD